MDLLHPAPAFASHQLRALTMVAAAATDGLRAPQRRFLEAVREVVFATGEDTDAPKPISPGELAAQVPDPAEALQLIRFMVVMAVCDGPPSKARNTRDTPGRARGRLWRARRLGAPEAPRVVRSWGGARDG